MTNNIQQYNVHRLDFKEHCRNQCEGSGPVKFLHPIVKLNIEIPENKYSTRYRRQPLKLPFQLPHMIWCAVSFGKRILTPPTKMLHPPDPPHLSPQKMGSSQFSSSTSTSNSSSVPSFMRAPGNTPTTCGARGPND